MDVSVLDREARCGLGPVKFSDLTASPPSVNPPCSPAHLAAVPDSLVFPGFSAHTVLCLEQLPPVCAPPSCTPTGTGGACGGGCDSPRVTEAGGG